MPTIDTYKLVAGVTDAHRCFVNVTLSHTLGFTQLSIFGTHTKSYYRNDTADEFSFKLLA